MRETVTKVTYDKEDDAAYIYLTPDTSAVNVAPRQVQIDAGFEEVNIIFDIDHSQRLRGIEILGASKCLPQKFLEQL